MASVLDLVKDSLFEVGALSPGEPLDANDGALCLVRLNSMRDTWNSEGLLIYEVRQESFSLVVDNQNPTIGPSGATFTSTRPTKIVDAHIVNTDVDPNERRLCEVVGEDRWVSRRLSNDTAEYPWFLYYEASYPNGTIHLSHKPTTVHMLELSTWQPWAAFASLANPLTLPPGYYECSMYNLAVRLANPFGIEPTALLVQMANSSRAQVKKLNRRIPVLRSDVPMGSRW